MWLVFDIGNSAIKGGLFDGERLDHTFTFSHEAGELAAVLDAELEAFDLHFSGTSARPGERRSKGGGRRSLRPVIDRAGICSVVPAGTERLTRVLGARGLRVTTVGCRMRLPIEMAYLTPETLGADRLAAAAAAWVIHGSEKRRSVVALDAGTALTYEVVDRDGTYLGGAIGPGPALMQGALHRETAQLPDVPLELPDKPIGRSTVEAIQAGIMYGFIESVRGLLRRIDEALGEETVVVATGGWGRFLRGHLDEVDAFDAHLVLQGVRILMKMNP